MGRVRIVTDSTADIPVDLAEELDISIVPCLICFGETTYRDNIDLSAQEFFTKLANSPVLPRTSQPRIHDFLEVYHRLLEQEGCEGIISVHVAGTFSGTLNSAWTAAQQLSDPHRVEVVDSGLVSMGMGWVVVEAARMARANHSQPAISQAIQELLPRSRTAAMIDNLENLYKGGRINQISAVLGTVLQIKPLLNIQRGEVLVWGRVRTHAKALQHLVTEVQSWGALKEMSILHGGAEDLAHRLAERLQDQRAESGDFSDLRLRIQPAGAALITHLGLGAVGVCALAAGQDR